MQKQLVENQNEVNMKKMRLEKGEKELHEMKRQFEENQKEKERIKEDIEEEVKTLRSLQKDFEFANDFWNSETLELLKEKLRNAEFNQRESSNSFERIQQKVGVALSSLFECRFNPPKSPNFQKESVFGRILGLISVKGSRFNKALEIIGGQKLFNVIVKDDETAALLLKANSFGVCAVSPFE